MADTPKIDWAAKLKEFMSNPEPCEDQEEFDNAVDRVMTKFMSSPNVHVKDDKNGR